MLPGPAAESSVREVEMRTTGTGSEPLTILVTGASAGLGLAICRQLAPQKPRLILAARSPQRLQAAAAELQATGCSVLAVPTDVAVPAELQRLVAAALAQFGRIDVLINNAGIECFSEFDALTEAEIEQTIATNLTGAILLTRLVVPGMKSQRFGRIINMASTAGKHGPAYGAVYGATKAGLIAFTQSTAVSVARAVESAIRTAPPERILNFPALRPMFLFRDVFPRLGERIILAVTRKFLRRAALAKQPSR